MRSACVTVSTNYITNYWGAVPRHFSDLTLRMIDRSKLFKKVLKASSAMKYEDEEYENSGKSYELLKKMPISMATI